MKDTTQMQVTESDIPVSEKLENWLRKNFMSSTEFCYLVGFSRATLWKIKYDMAICEKYVEKVKEITKGEVVPKISNPGRKHNDKS